MHRLNKVSLPATYTMLLTGEEGENISKLIEEHCEWFSTIFESIIPLNKKVVLGNREL